MKNKLIVYIDSDKKPKMQPIAFAGTKLNTCNYDSTIGINLRHTHNRIYFSCTPENIYDKQSISGKIHYGVIEFKSKFKNMKEFIMFMEHITSKSLFKKRLY